MCIYWTTLHYSSVHVLRLLYSSSTSRECCPKSPVLQNILTPLSNTLLLPLPLYTYNKTQSKMDLMLLRPHTAQHNIIPDICQQSKQKYIPRKQQLNFVAADKAMALNHTQNYRNSNLMYTNSSNPYMSLTSGANSLCIFQYPLK